MHWVIVQTMPTVDYSEMIILHPSQCEFCRVPSVGVQIKAHLESTL